MKDRPIRLFTGLVLLSYLGTHLLNHALGLISLEAMEVGRGWFLALWRNPLGTVALYGSLIVHLGLAFYSLFRRHHLRMPLWEALQLTLGLCIPLLLTVHVVGTRLAYEWHGVEDSYAKIVLSLWRNSPVHGVRQSLLIAIAWLHGSIGFHFWLRLRPWYARFAPTLFAVGLLLPVLGLLGFVYAGREIDHLIELNPRWVEQQGIETLNRGEGYDLVMTRDGIIYTFWGSLGAMLLARAARHLYRRRRRVRILYPEAKEVFVPRGFSVLEASRFAGIPHASVCGGRGRCSTCRVRVLEGHDWLPSPSPGEARVLARVGAPPNVRLACQLRPTHDLTAHPLLPANARASDGYSQPSYLAGQEQNIVIMFTDLRSFTGLAERKLPYDLVFILNRYFEVVGEAVTHAGGVVDKFIGDGAMALFGIEDGAEEGCRRALAAAAQIVDGVAKLSHSLAVELAEPLKIGIGIHAGPAVVGRMGYGTATHLTAIGDTVNVASRLQDLTKEYACQMIISEQVARHSGLDASLLPRHELAVRNRREPLSLYIIDDVRVIGVPRSP
jgi:adenylate cyclase